MEQSPLNPKQQKARSSLNAVLTDAKRYLTNREKNTGVMGHNVGAEKQADMTDMGNGDPTG